MKSGSACCHKNERRGPTGESVWINIRQVDLLLVLVWIGGHLVFGASAKLLVGSEGV